MILKIPFGQSGTGTCRIARRHHGCTDSSLDYEQAHEIVDRWKRRISQEEQVAPDPVAGRLRQLAGTLNATLLCT